METEAKNHSWFIWLQIKVQSEFLIDKWKTSIPETHQFPGPSSPTLESCILNKPLPQGKKSRRKRLQSQKCVTAYKILTVNMASVFPKLVSPCCSSFKTKDRSKLLPSTFLPHKQTSSLGIANKVVIFRGQGREIKRWSQDTVKNFTPFVINDFRLLNIIFIFQRQCEALSKQKDSNVLQRKKKASFPKSLQYK